MALFLKDKRQVLNLPVDHIHPNPNQPRSIFSQAELQELSDSIVQLGILQPLSVRKVGGEWELISGERRLRAAQMAGMTMVPCLVVQTDEETSSLLALVENIQRRNLDVWEEAIALRRLITLHHMSQDEVARRVGKSQSAVANKLRLLKLPPDVIDILRLSSPSGTPGRCSSWTMETTSARPPSTSSATTSRWPSPRRTSPSCARTPRPSSPPPPSCASRMCGYSSTPCAAR